MGGVQGVRGEQDRARAEWEALSAEYEQLWEELERLHWQDPPDVAGQHALWVRIGRHRQQLLAWRDCWLGREPKGP